MKTNKINKIYKFKQNYAKKFLGFHGYKKKILYKFLYRNYNFY